MVPVVALPGVHAYDVVREALATERCVIVDGETADGADVLQTHRNHVRAGCDVITVDARAVQRGARWIEAVRNGVRVARRAIASEAREGRVAVALALDPDIDGVGGPQMTALLGRALDADVPDLLIVEDLSIVRPSLFAAVDALLATGLPVWLSFNRCMEGLCGVYGQHWGGPEGDEFACAAQRFEHLGVDALLISSVPPDHVEGMLSHLREYTGLPLGVAPNAGYATSEGWRFDEGVADTDFARMALRWRGEGAQIIGGCGGVGPEHIAAAREALADTVPGTPRSAPSQLEPATTPRAWMDTGDRPVYPLPMPDVAADGEVFVPTQGSFLVWRHLFREQIGRDAKCLEVGCGSGLQTIQLARNGAEHVHAIDIDPDAVEVTLANARRNGVADRVSAEAVDLYPWVPEHRYDVVVASLYQTPVDPLDAAATHRPADFWGRNSVDHLIGLLPTLLTGSGVAYVMQLSILSQQRTDELLARNGLQARVADFAFFPFSENFRQSQEQIAVVEQMSDAHHHVVAGDDVMVAYLLEITRAT
jgi:S-methylmethionine-dependent homocysteine/selenocysteine methylase/SAM-dependent methyltransferase